MEWLVARHRHRQIQHLEAVILVLPKRVRVTQPGRKTGAEAVATSIIMTKMKSMLENIQQQAHLICYDDTVHLPNMRVIEGETEKENHAKWISYFCAVEEETSEDNMDLQ